MEETPQYKRHDELERLINATGSNPVQIHEDLPYLLQLTDHEVKDSIKELNRSEKKNKSEKVNEIEERQRVRREVIRFLMKDQEPGKHPSDAEEMDVYMEFRTEEAKGHIIISNRTSIKRVIVIITKSLAFAILIGLAGWQIYKLDWQAKEATQFAQRTESQLQDLKAYNDGLQTDIIKNNPQIVQAIFPSSVVEPEKLASNVFPDSTTSFYFQTINSERTLHWSEIPLREYSIEVKDINGNEYFGPINYDVYKVEKRNSKDKWVPIYRATLYKEANSFKFDAGLLQLQLNHAAAAYAALKHDFTYLGIYTIKIYIANPHYGNPTKYKSTFESKYKESRHTAHVTNTDGIDVDLGIFHRDLNVPWMPLPGYVTVEIKKKRDLVTYILNKTKNTEG